MSQIAAGKGHAVPHDSHAADHGHAVRIDPEAVTMSGGGSWSMGLLFVGIVGIVVTVIGGFTDAKHALAAYHAGAIYTVGLAIGSLMLVMIMQQFNAGWSAAIRRHWETVASLVPVALILLLPGLLSTVFSRGTLFEWTDPKWYDAAGHPSEEVLLHKSTYLNIPFFFIRAALYAGIWTILATLLYRWSREQDTSGDRLLTARSRHMSSYGIVLLALTTAFAGFDWVMGLDYHWFSTMFGVYFFIGNLLSAVALMVLILTVLRKKGKLAGIVTEEHMHDLGKLLIAFTVFWAYITFSQYFLIWYSDIPEETGWFIVRRSNGWMGVGLILAICHFFIPFLLLLWRFTKRNSNAVALLALWLLVVHFIDVMYMVRPSVLPTQGPAHLIWIDIAGWLGPVCIFLGIVAGRIAANPLIPLKDPRLAEALHHKNYV